MVKLQLTLTEEEAALLAGYGSQLGYNLAKTARFFISKATSQILSEGIVPVYKMSEKTELKGLEALAEHRAGKTTQVTDVSTFFEKL